jgi:N utilization substance protein B
MLNRRILRIKVFQALYAYNKEEQAITSRYETFLLNSIKRIEETYLFILNLPVELKYYIENEANPEEIKYFPSKREIETGNTFLYNLVIQKIQDSIPFKERSKKMVSHNWHDNKELLRIIFNDFKGGEIFQAYLDNSNKDFEAQKKLMLNFFVNHLPKSEDFDQYMEEINIHWQDDKKILFKYLTKTIENIKEDKENNFLVNLTGNWNEDWEYARDLFKKTLENNSFYEDLISKKTVKWDSDRIATTDMILMKMALCEMMDFPSIPLKVTINEYLEISKMYSTPKSNTFLNGVLDKIKNELKAENKIVKQGRGLVE